MIDSVTLALPKQLDLPVEAKDLTIPPDVRTDACNAIFPVTDWEHEADIYTAEGNLGAVDLENLVRNQILSRNPDSTPPSRAKGLELYLVDGLCMVHFPFNTPILRSSTDPYEKTPADRFLYLPRDVDSLVIQAGRTCLAVVSHSFDAEEFPQSYEFLNLLPANR